MTAATANKRSVRNILINRPLQREFTISLIAIMMAAGVIVGVMIHMTLGGLTEGAPRTLSRFALERMLADVNAQLVMGTLLVIFLAVILTGFFGVFFLHRVAGPVYRFNVVLKQMARGEVPREIKLRQRDFFKETAMSLNEVILVLKRHEGASKRLETLIERQGLSSEASAELREIQKTLSSTHSPSS